MNGLIVDIFRTTYDGSNEGLSALFDEVTLIGPKISGPFEPAETRPAVTIITRPDIGRHGAPYHHAVPCDAEGQPLPGWWMFGGTYLKTSDSRFPFDYPVPLHDRLEGQNCSYPVFEPQSDKQGLINQVRIILSSLPAGEPTHETRLLLEALADDLRHCSFSWIGGE